MASVPWRLGSQTKRRRYRATGPLSSLQLWWQGARANESGSSGGLLTRAARGRGAVGASSRVAGGGGAAWGVRTLQVFLPPAGCQQLAQLGLETRYLVPKAKPTPAHEFSVPPHPTAAFRIQNHPRACCSDPSHLTRPHSGCSWEVMWVSALGRHSTPLLPE